MMRWLYRLGDRARERALRKKWAPDRAAGRRGEDLAHRFLQREGFTVVARNYRPRSGNGEIDLVAWEGDTLVFVEVKSRHSEEYGAPERNIDFEKRRAMARAARDYTRRAEVAWDKVRLDVVTVVLSMPPVIRLMRGAISPEPLRPSAS